MFVVGLAAVNVIAELGAVIVDNVRMPSADLSNTEVPSLMGRIIRKTSHPAALTVSG